MVIFLYLLRAIPEPLSINYDCRLALLDVSGFKSYFEVTRGLIGCTMRYNYMVIRSEARKIAVTSLIPFI